MKRYLKKIIHISIFTLPSLFFIGCASSETNQISTKKIIIEKNYKPYNFKYRPIIKSNSDDSNVIIDQGVVLKAWINTYKIGRGTLVPSHYVYVRVKEPDFIPQYAIPPRQNKQAMIQKDLKRLPFMPSNQEIDRSDTESNENIVKYVNSYYEKNDKNEESKRLNESKKFDEDIKQYLKSKREE